MVARFKSEQRAAGLGEEPARAAAVEAALALWKKVQRVTRVAPVEATTPALVRGLQARGITVMGLTARPADLADATFQQLASAGFDLAARPIASGEIGLASNRDVNRVARYTRGVLFSGLNPKGEMLVKLLGHRRVKLRPTRIVFVDDKAGNVESVERSLGKRSIPHLSFRYGAADPKVKGFRRERADLQLLHFGGILPDPAADLLATAGR